MEPYKYNAKKKTLKTEYNTIKLQRSNRIRLNSWVSKVRDKI